MAENEKKVVMTETKSPKPEKKEKKKEKKEKKDFWRGFKSETKKIVWPTWKQVLKNAGIVLAIVIVCAIMIAALDYVFGRGIPALAELLNFKGA